MSNINKRGVAIIDFGSQYTQLIARRIREFDVFSEIFSPEDAIENILKNDPKAIILSGGPSSIFKSEAPNFDHNILDLKIPILGICYGLHILIHHAGGLVKSNGVGEYGFADITIKGNSKLFKGIKKSTSVWMSHMDQVLEVPGGWSIEATSSNSIIASIVNKDKNRYATQFHPEVSHTKEGTQLLRNFIFSVSKCASNWSANNLIENQILKIRETVQDDNVLIGVSGGVDSSVVAAIMHKAIGGQCKAVMIDHGLLRKNEGIECETFLRDGLGIDITVYDESEIFLSKLNNVSDPEEKRKIIGNQFIYSFDDIANKAGEFKYLAQGTLYPDVIESGISKGKKAHLIKSHHNVGGLPKNMKFKLIEPLRDLFKDEVRKLGKELGLSPRLVDRHPFPGPGLGVRIVGKINKNRVSILQEADAIYMKILQDQNIYNDIWQAFAVLIPVKTVGVMGDQRTYEYLLALRAVTSIDGMTADWFRMPDDILAKISTEIINNVKGINRVVYDITSKPPGTIEWE